MRRQDAKVLSDNDKKSIRDAEEYLDHQEEYTEEDPFFEEVAAILKEIDKKKDEDDHYFDDILSQIPSDEVRQIIADESLESALDADKRMDTLIAEQDELDAKFVRDRKRERYLKSVEMEIMSENYINLTLLQSRTQQQQGEHDDNRITQLLAHIKVKVRALGVWSPAKNMYQKILNNKQLSDYDKCQQVIAMAEEIHENNLRNERGFILKRLMHKGNKIHEEIAKLDINSDEMVNARFVF